MTEMRGINDLDILRYALSPYRKKYNKYFTNARWIRINRKLRRRELMIILGGIVCSNPNCLVFGRCRDIRCLQLDHKNSGGIKDYKRFHDTHEMVKYYLNHIDEAKQTLQVLCANCNWIKRHTNNECKVKEW